MKKADGRIEALESKNRVLEAKLKKAEGRNQNARSGVSDSLDEKGELKASESKPQPNVSWLEIQLGAVERRVVEQEKFKRVADLDITQLWRSVISHDTKTSTYVTRLKDLEAWRERQEAYPGW